MAPTAGSCVKGTEIVVVYPFVLTVRPGVVLLPSMYATALLDPRIVAVFCAINTPPLK